MMKNIEKVAKQIREKKRNGERWDVEYYKKNMGKKVDINKSAKNVAKADAPIQTSTTGVLNQVYGAELWAHFNQTTNPFAVLPKNPWSKSGWRALTARASSSADGAVAESGSIPDSIKPTFKELSADPATTAHVGEVSQVQNLLAQTDDDAVGDIADVRAYIGEQHRRDLSEQLMRPIENSTGDRMLSLDKIVASSEEVDNNGSISSGSADIYGLDRSSEAWSEAVVDHNDGTNRNLTDQIIRGLKRDVNNNVGDQIGNRFWMTGNDVLTEVERLYDDQTRYNSPFQDDSVEFNLDVNGISAGSGGEGGTGVGFTVASLYGYPIVTTDQAPAAPQDDALSKMFLLDTGDPMGHGSPRLGVSVLKPTTVYEAGNGTENDNPFLIDKFGGQILVETIGEVKARRMDAQGKITDIQSS